MGPFRDSSSVGFEYTSLTMSVLYIFMDHAGELRFFPQSNRYFVLASLSTWDTSEFGAAYHALRHQLVEADPMGEWDHHRFHASEDPPWVMAKFLKLIGARSDFRVDTVSVRKNRIYPDYRPKHVFYPLMTDLLLKHVLPIMMAQKTPDRVEIILDQFPLKGLELTTFIHKMESAIKPLCLQSLCKLRFHRSEAHPHLQAVDYVAWADYRRYEHGDWEPRKLVNNVLKSSWEYATRTTHEMY